MLSQFWRVWVLIELSFQLLIIFILFYFVLFIFCLYIGQTKTGGLVVWHKRYTLVVYRGSNYLLIPEASHNLAITIGGEASSSKLNLGKSEDGGAVLPTKSDEITNISVIQQDGDAENTHTSSMAWEIGNAAEAIKGKLYEREVDRLLDGLGPRFIDWWWRKPLPVDADLLPEFVPNFRPPFRLCPPSVKPKLTDGELTYLRKLARPLPTHFALGILVTENLPLLS